MTLLPDSEQVFQPDSDFSNDDNTLENFSSIGFACSATEFLLLLEVLDLLSLVERSQISGIYIIVHFFANRGTFR